MVELIYDIEQVRLILKKVSNPKPALNIFFENARDARVLSAHTMVLRTLVSIADFP